jgi:hypothetical protein
MLLYLGKDTGAQFAVSQELSMSDLALMHVTCRTWKLWLEEGTPVLSNRRLQLKPSALPSLVASKWVLRRVDDLRMIPEGDIPVVAEQCVEHRTEQQSLLRNALALLPAFHRLKRMELCSSVDFFDVASVRVCFSALANRLTHLKLKLPDRLTSLVFPEVGLLKRLESLCVHTRMTRVLRVDSVLLISLRSLT